MNVGGTNGTLCPSKKLDFEHSTFITKSQVVGFQQIYWGQLDALSTCMANFDISSGCCTQSTVNTTTAVRKLWYCAPKVRQHLRASARTFFEQVHYFLSTVPTVNLIYFIYYYEIAYKKKQTKTEKYLPVCLSLRFLFFGSS